jgi:LCP family protein required for cell wall assembly
MPAGDSRRGPDPSKPGTVYRAKPKLRARRGKAGTGDPAGPAPFHLPGGRLDPAASAAAPPDSGPTPAGETARDGHTRTWSAAQPSPPAPPGTPPPNTRPPNAPPRYPAGAPAPSKPPRAPRSRRRWWRIAAVVALVALVGYPLLLGFTAWRNLGRTDPLPTSSVADSPGTTYLVVGSDSRAGLTKAQKKRLGTGSVGGQRTDTIMLLHVPDGGGPNVLLSIPRDSFVSIPGHGKNKINAAYAFGGEKLLVKTVEQATGLKVDRYVETGLGGFADVVDAVGGVEVCVKHALNDKKAHINVKKGCQTMDGKTALGYARARYSDLRGDLGRVERQRQVLAAIAKKTLSPGVIVQPWRGLPAAAAGGGALTFDDDAGPLDVERFLMAMRATSGGKGLSLTVPISNPNLSTSAGSAVGWDDAQADKVFDAIRAGDTEKIRPIAQEQADAVK